MPSRRRGRRIQVVLAVLVALAAAGALWLLRDPRPRFVERRSQLVSADEGPETRDAGHASRSVTLRAANGIHDPIVRIDHFGGYWIKDSAAAARVPR